MLTCTEAASWLVGASLVVMAEPLTQVALVGRFDGPESLCTVEGAVDGDSVFKDVRGILSRGKADDH
jgi:hypothetical protein